MCHLHTLGTQNLKSPPVVGNAVLHPVPSSATLCSPHIPQVPQQHIPVCSSTSHGSPSTFPSYVNTSSFLPSPHLYIGVAVGMCLQKVASGIRRGTVSQGAEGGRLGQELGLSCTQYFSQQRRDGARMCQKLLGVCAVCSWNDNQIGRVHISSANC